MEEKGPVYEVNGNHITVVGGDMGFESEEGTDDQAEQKIDIVHSFRLQPTSFDKKSYLLHLKDYMKNVEGKLKETNPERVESFKKEAQEYAKQIVANFKDYEFYTGESMNPDGQVALLNYREDGITPYFTLWKDGLKGMKI